MTIEQSGPGSELATYEEDFGSLGMEDVEASDLVIPRIGIDHKRNVFVNGLTKEEFPALTVVVLGLIKQRIMWPPKLEDDSKPRCKSPDNTHGFPNMVEGQPRRNLFPWDESNFTPDMAKVIELPPDSKYPNGWSSNGHLTLPCDACAFAKWGKDEDNKSVPPPCSEQHTYPLMYLVVDPETGEQQWLPALFTVARSAIKNSKNFINSFAQARQPFFTQYTILTLRQESRGGNEFSVPEFTRHGPSDRSAWAEYGDRLKSIREFIRRAPRPNEGEDDPVTISNNENVAPTPPPSAPAPAPAAAPVPEAQTVNVTVPATPTPPAPPAPPVPPAAPVAPPQPAATAPVPPAPAPVAPPTPPTPPAPPTPPVAAQPEAPASSGGDDLPF